ncbi:MAG: ketopantoate reductase family protein [Myxococcales bacterium]|nr:ketopantoate reductase family protein [Myxococcales bacterium]
MKIAVFGAGVIGSLYAAKLKRAGEDVTVLARGKRLEDLRSRGLEIEDMRTGARTQAAVRVVAELDAEEPYDLVLVALRAHQISGALSALASNRAARAFLLMVNNAGGYDAWSDTLGAERLALAFPGAGGSFQGSVVRYRVVSGLLQPTTFGEPSGPPTARLREMARMIRRAGFPIAFSARMDAWQKHHAAWIAPVAAAAWVLAETGHGQREEADTLRLSVRAIREGFANLRGLGHPVTPASLRAWTLIPTPLLVAALRRAFATEFARTALAAQSSSARDEIRVLTDQLRAIGREARLPTPALDALHVCLG